jgi:hypothetical protein
MADLPDPGTFGAALAEFMRAMSAAATHGESAVVTRLRQAWLRAVLEQREAPTADDIRLVLDELLDDRSTLTRRLLGQAGPDAGPEVTGHPAMRSALRAAGLPIPHFG